MVKKICIIKSNTYRLNLKIKEYYQNFFNLTIDDDDIYNTKYNEYPSIKTIEDYDIFIFTGTKCIDILCNDKPDFLEKMLKLIKDIIDANKLIYGTCFGHQLLSHFFGASIKRRCENNYWEIGFINLPLNKIGKNLFPFDKCPKITNLTQITVHHDYVYSIENTNLYPLLKNQNSLLITLNKENKIQTISCQGHFLFDESYFLKHHVNMIENNEIEYKYKKNLIENQLGSQEVKKKYLLSKKYMKQFVKYYLIDRNTVTRTLLDIIKKNLYSKKEKIKNCD